MTVTLFYMHESGGGEQCLSPVGLPFQLEWVGAQTLLWFLQRREIQPIHDN